MSVSDLRFNTVQALRSAAKRVPLVKYSRSRDEKGYFIADYELDPITKEMIREVSGFAAVEPAPVKEDVITPYEGPVHRIREWVKAHPKATREDALKHFADLNPGTVRIQFMKVRKAK